MSADEMPCHSWPAPVLLASGAAAHGDRPVDTDRAERWARAVAATTARDAIDPSWLTQSTDESHGPAEPDAVSMPDEILRASATEFSSSECDREPFEPGPDPERHSTSRNGATSSEEPPSSPVPASQDVPARRTHRTVEVDATAHAGDRADPNTLRTLPLSALRGLHTSRQSKPDVSATGNDAPTDIAALPASTDTPPLMAAATEHATPIALSDTAGRPVDSLQTLVESCCDRLWISDGRGSAPQGVMLDVGRWMPGCTIEVARAGGVVHLHMRGVEDTRRREVTQHLNSLSDALAQKLGCRVVSAVESRQDEQA